MRGTSLFLLLILVSLTKTFAWGVNSGIQLSDLRSQKDSVVSKKHSPKKATIYSAVLPGLGQAYNRKYWKMPIIYAAIGTSAFFMIKNADSMRQRQDALKSMLDSDPNTNAPAKYANTPVSVLRSERNFYRTNRDYSIIALSAFYVLNILDAAVDAHFYKFNIDQPLALRKERKWHLAGNRVGSVPTFGLSYRF
ncbi:MAG: hypothetical protein JNM67_04150 [Bacteroidetes bacterium]|nr:hypothetical protein [Bacteroidota bacterium]